MADQEYQGWSNYETWAVALMLDNDRAEYEFVMSLVEDCLEMGNSNKETETLEEFLHSDCEINLADTLRDYIEDNNPLEGQATVYGQLLMGAIHNVNWMELAEHFLDR